MFRRGIRTAMAKVLCMAIVSALVLPCLAVIQPGTAMAGEGGQTGVWEEVYLITNPSFEDEPGTTNVKINGWRYHPSLYAKGAELSSEAAFDGTRSLKFTGEKGMGVETYSPIPVKAGEKYKVSLYVNLTSLAGTPTAVGFRFFDETGATQVQLKTFPLPTNMPAGQWTQFTTDEVTVPDGAAGMRILIVSNSQTEMVGYFDKVQLFKYEEESQEPEQPADSEQPAPEDPQEPEEPAEDPWMKLNIPNAGFEAAPAGGTLGIEGWKYLNTGYATGAVLSTDIAYEGSQSVHFSGVKNMGVETEPFPVTAGNNYKATVQAYVQSLEGDIRVWFRWYRNGTHLVDTYLTVKNAEVKLNEWMQLAITGTAPEEATHGSVLIYASSGTSITGYFDDLQVFEYATPAPEDPNELKVINGGFEEPATGGAIPGWTFWDGGYKTGVAVTNEKAHEGKQSLKFENVKTTGLQSTLIPITPGEQYKATAKLYYKSTSSGEPAIWLRWYTINNTLISNADSVFRLTDIKADDWNTMEVIGRAPSNAAYAMIFLYASSGVVLNGYVDDVRMYKVVDPNELKLPYEYGTPIDLGDATLLAKTNGVVIANGEMYFATNGAPAKFFAVSIETGEILASSTLQGLDTVWAITAGSDGKIYFGATTNGNLYRYDPATRQVENLGKNPGGTFIWDLDASDDGKIYGGTYPTGEMFEYDIASGQFKNLGVLQEGQQYVRGTGVSGNYAYGGTGSFAYLFKFDRNDHTKTRIPLPIDGVDTMVSNIWKYNDLLFVAYGTSLIIMNEDTAEIKQHWSWQSPLTFDGMISPPSPYDGDLIYFRHKNTSELYTYNTATNEVAPVEPRVILPAESLKAMNWATLSSGETVLVMVTGSAKYAIYNPVDNTLKEYAANVDKQGVYVNSMEVGPDGKIYLGGYQGSYSIYDPATGKYLIQSGDMQQTEGIGFYNGKVYFGTYGSAVIYRYDPAKPINFGNTPEHNPGIVKDIADDQDRPFVFETGGGKLFIGTIPAYGTLGGAVTVYDEAAGTWETYRNIVNNQSIFGLAYHERDGLLYGGTSVAGGLGIDPSEPAAKLFVWNPATKELVKAFVPQIEGVARPQLLGELAFDGNGLLWGGFAGYNDDDKVVKGIFAYDPASDSIVKSKILLENVDMGSMMRPYYLRWENGLLYTTIGSQLIVIDPDTLKYRKLLDQTVNLMTVGHDGSVYYVYGSKVYKLPVALDTVTLTADQTTIEVGKEAGLKLSGKLINGRDAYVYAGTIVYASGDEKVVKAENGVLKAIGAGTAEVWATVTLDGVTKTSNSVTVTVTEAALELPYEYGAPIDLGEATLLTKTNGVAIANGQIYFATNGSPATFYAVDIETGEIATSQRLSGFDTVWAITAGSDGKIYFGATANGNLYRYDPDTKQIENLGKNPGGTWIWDLDAGKDGKLYGGTYPTGEMFEYDIAAGEFKYLGVLKEGQQYVRGTGVSDDYAYGGTGAFAYLYKFDRKTYTKTQIPLPIDGQETMVSNIWNYNGLLFIAYGTSLIIMDEASGTIKQHLYWQDPFTFDGMISPPSPYDNHLIYFRGKNDNYLYTYNTATDEFSATGITLPAETMKAMNWVTLSSGETVLVMVTGSAKYAIYNPVDNTLETYSTSVDMQGVSVNSMEIGPDGKIYLGGYQGGYSIYDPAAGKYIIQSGSMQQTEGIGFYNGKVYFGTYGQAMIYRYDPTKPINFGNTPEHNPGLVIDIDDDQDRPFVLKAGGGKLFIGTFPGYGMLGGALAVYDETTGKTETYRNIVNKQSIFGLAYNERDGLLYGGTSVAGGLGVNPSEPAAKLFVWNPATKELVKAFVPQIDGVERPQMIGDLSVDGNGLLWAGFAGYNSENKVVKGIFAYDPASDSIVKSKILLENADMGSMMRPYYLRWENGLLYTTIGSQLIVIDPDTLSHLKLVNQTVNLMTIAPDGSVYYASGAKLYKLPVALDSVQLTADQTTIEVGKEAGLKLSGKLINGRDAYVYAGTIVYASGDEKVVKAENGVLKAVGEGTAEVWATVTLDGVTKKTNSVTVTVTRASMPLPYERGMPGTPSDSGPSGETGDTALSEELKVKVVGTGEQDGHEVLVLAVEELLGSSEQGYTIKVPESTNNVVVQVNGSLLAQINEEQASLNIKGNQASVTIPAGAIDVEAVAGALGAAAEDVVIEIQVASATGEQAAFAQAVLNAGGYEMVGMPVTAKVTAAYGDRSVTVDRFEGFGVTAMAVPEGVASDARLTAVIVEEDGTVRPVPTRLVTVDGRLTAVLAHTTGGAIALIKYEASFRDIEGHWAQEEIVDMGSRLIVNGLPDGNFAPDKEVTRAEFTAMIVRSLGLKGSGSAVSFRDVDEDDWFAPAVAAAVEYGLMQGTDEGGFQPQQTVTREQVMIIAARVLALLNISVEGSGDPLAAYADGESVSAWALDGARKAVQAGIIQGRAADELAPGATMTRAEAVVVIQRLLQVAGWI